MTSTNCQLEVRTVQAHAFKILMDGLKELLTECCIDFDESGMKIVSTDNAHVVLVHLKLHADKFEFFYVANKLTIGINMLHLYKLIKTINSNDTLTLFIDKNDVNHLGIKIENGDKNTKTTYKLNLLDLDNQKISIDPAEFNYVITLPSVDFQKICRDMNDIADVIEIKNVGNQLILSCAGDFCSQETVLIDSENGVNRINNLKDTDEIVQGLYNLKFLVMFTKCTNLCPTVELFLKNDYPFLCTYMVGSMGTLRLALAPQSGGDKKPY